MRKGIFIVLFLMPYFAYADFINLVQADKCETLLEIFIQEDRIVVKLEIGAQDYPWFSDVIPIEFFEGGFSSQNARTRWSRFMNHQFLLSCRNRRLTGDINAVEQRNRISRAGLYTGQTDSAVVNEKIMYVEIEYPLNSKIPELAITPPLPKGTGTTMANIGFVVYHKAVPVNDLRFLRAKERLFLDWEDPWYSYFENKDISRHHNSSFMSFLYVEPYEVRHELLGRIKDLEGWMDFKYGMDDLIEVEEQEELKRHIAEFLVKRNIVRIDGEEVKPVIDRIHFVEVQLSGIQIIEIPKPIPYSSAIIGVIFAYPHESMPKEVTVHWDMFNDKIQRIPCMSIDPAGPWPYDLQPSDSVLKWTNFLKHYKLPTVTEQKVENATVHIPLFSAIFLFMIIFLLYRNEWTLNGLSKWKKFFFVLYLLLAILAFPVGYRANIPFLTRQSYSEPEARDLINQLLKNTYRAFDFREEGDVYDKLAMCNDERLLQQVYLQTRKSMVIENQGGIEAKVDEVLVTSVQKEASEEGLAYRSKWIVKGVVGHWGHKHRRINQYDAIIKLKPIDGAWKMFDFDIIEEVRL
ncbi:MAG: hypothetical protein MI975_05085 [Cytophagales bacterium]|nr:hypothetical protein [Cytophagales bacterium]